LRATRSSGRVIVVRSSVVVVEIDKRDLGQLAMHVGGICSGELVLQWQIDDLWSIGGLGQISKERCYCNVAVVRRFGSNGCAVGVDWLPGLIAVIGAAERLEDVLVAQRKLFECQTYP
jgi:hypothetical protein